jgi:UDP-glucuronate decarboxylase
MNTPDQITGPMNLGNPAEFTILQLAEQVVELVGTKSRLVFKPLPSDDPKQRQPDITLAKETLAWEPKIALRDGLIKTIAYFDAQLSNGK